MDNTIAVPHQSYDALRHEIKSGDILLCSGKSLFSTLIQNATHSEWSHVAFVLRLDMIGRIMVLESVESIGVRTVPLSSYVQNYDATGAGYPGTLLLARHCNLKQENIANLSKHAIDLLGYPYNKEDILRIATRLSIQNLGLRDADTPSLLPSRAFICSEYAYCCFKSVGIDIAYDPAGFIAPADFARDPNIKPISFIKTQEENMVN